MPKKENIQPIQSKISRNGVIHNPEACSGFSYLTKPGCTQKPQWQILLVTGGIGQSVPYSTISGSKIFVLV
nr:hypothetical transcript [Hymenolepis microstoma]